MHASVILLHVIKSAKLTAKSACTNSSLCCTNSKLPVLLLCLWPKYGAFQVLHAVSDYDNV